MFGKNKVKNIKALSGVLELTPAEQIVFERYKKEIANIYEQYGFIPLNTSTIERSEILFAKAGGDTEKEIYRIDKKGDSDLALRFDLTVPLARYVAANYNDITFPFRRYQIAKSFRGERPQKGRFREFYQSDIDIIGDGELSIKNDAEIISIIYSIFTKLNLGPFIIRISNRKILTGALEQYGVTEDAVGVIDKWEKIGEKKVKDMLLDMNVSGDDIYNIFRLIKLEGSNEDKVRALKELDISNPTYLQGVEELEEVLNLTKLFNVPEDYYTLDLTVVRGLDYYTGTIYETTLVDFPEIGSVCSGGRYDNLTQYYVDRKLPGVGVSIGLSRVFSAVKESKVDDVSTLSKLLVLPLTDDISEAVNVANTLRKAGVSVEVYMEEKKMKQKMNYANKKGFRYIVLLGEDEIESGEYTLKNMETGDQQTLNLEELTNMMLTDI